MQFKIAFSIGRQSPLLWLVEPRGVRLNFDTEWFSLLTTCRRRHHCIIDSAVDGWKFCATDAKRVLFFPQPWIVAENRFLPPFCDLVHTAWPLPRQRHCQARKRWKESLPVSRCGCRSRRHFIFRPRSDVSLTWHMTFRSQCLLTFQPPEINIKLTDSQGKKRVIDYISLNRDVIVTFRIIINVYY